MVDKYLLSAKSCFPDTGAWEFRNISVWTGEMLQFCYLSSLCSQKQRLCPVGKLIEKPKLPNGTYLALLGGPEILDFIIVTLWALDKLFLEVSLKFDQL